MTVIKRAAGALRAFCAPDLQILFFEQNRPQPCSNLQSTNLAIVLACNSFQVIQAFQKQLQTQLIQTPTTIPIIPSSIHQLQNKP